MSKAWLFVALGVIGSAPTARAVPQPGTHRRAPALFSGFLGRMNVNQWDCGLDALGHVCVDPNGSTTVGGGFWPKGTPDQYVFGSGMQVSGIVDPTSGFKWAGDTTAAFFEDPSGTHENGDKLSLIWQSTNSDDAANWPRDAYVPSDPTLFSPILFGKKAASQEDVWARLWDGNPNLNAGRPHPLGVLVDERGMAWNFPSGNEAIQYWVYTITNITASDDSVYVNAGHAVDHDSLTALGRRFKAQNDAAFGVTIPSRGYKVVNAYVAFAADMDVSVSARQNFTTAFLPFFMGVAFKSNWYAPEFIYPSTLFGPPFAPTVGEVGVKYLKSPVDPSTGQEVGLTLYSGTVNGGAFGDAANAAQVYRYHAGTLNPALGDAPCNYPRAPTQQPKDVHVCYIPSTPDDIRFFQSSGPLTLAPGQSQSIVVAYIAAAPVDNPAIAARSASLVFPKGGPFPAQPESLALNKDTLRTVDHIFGAVNLVGDTGGKPGGGPNGKIDQNEVNVVPRSLLGKGLVAQAVFDAHFLLPFPPDAPQFFLVPGDNQVTVVWKQTDTEQTGDPYFAVAGDASSPLYDPNYREFDVEGYRVYRGRTSGDLQVVAQFDKAGTNFIDFTGELNYGNCAPELGVTTDCPSDMATGHAVDIVSPFVQIPPGGRVKLSPSNNVFVIQADTAVTGNGSNFPLLNDKGIPFAFVDKGVANGFTYFYTVAAFDVNSVKSTGIGSASLESKLPPLTAVPRKASKQDAGGGGATVLQTPNGAPLAVGSVPSIDKTTGEFSGPMPATDGLAAGFALDVGQLISAATVSMQIDSIVPGNADPDGIGTAAPAVYYVTLQRAAPNPPIQIKVPVSVDATDATATGTAYGPLVALVSKTKTARFKGDSTYALSAGATVTVPGTWRTTSFGRASINEDPADADFNGPRWWSGAANENTADPNSTVCSPAAGACVQGNLNRTAGALAGVDSIFHLQSYSTVRSLPMRDIEGILSTVVRAADFAVYWGPTTNGSAVIDSVVDVTHKATVPFSKQVRASWGILDDSSFVGIPAVTATRTEDKKNGLLTWSDIFCVAPLNAFGIQDNGKVAICADTIKADTAPLRNRAHLSPIAITSIIDTLTPTLTATGNGFAFYLNGHFFLMKMAALPTQGTVWHARFYAGNVTGSSGSYAFVSAVRPPAVPGLKAVGSFTGNTFDSTHVSDSLLASIHTVPDPYYVTNAFEQSPNSKILRFVNLPSECIIRIYSLSGILVQMIAIHDPLGGGEAQWNLRNRNNQFVASGVYFYHVETPDGKSKIGRFTIVNFAQ